MSEKIRKTRRRRTPKAWLKRYFRILLGGTILLFVLAFCFVGPIISEYDPDAINMGNRMATPSAEHWFGTDDYGRDYFARLAYGGRITIFIALTAQVFVILAGTVNGMLCGYYRKYDNVMSRIMEAIHSLPTLLTVLMIAGLIGTGIPAVVIAIVIAGLPGITRNLRGQVLQLRSLEFIEAEKAMGASAPRTIFLHMMPQTFNYLIIRFSTGISSGMLSTASMAYLGVGISPDTPNWGGMISQGQDVMLIYPNLVIWPGLAIILTMFGFSMLGEGIRDILDPKYR